MRERKKLKCSKCGQILEEDAGFCTACGSAVIKRKEKKQVNKMFLIIALIAAIGGIIFIIGIRGRKENSDDVLNESNKLEMEQINVDEIVEETMFFSPLSCLISYMEKMTHGYIDEMLDMIPNEEVEVGKKYDSNILSDYKSFYSTLIKNNDVYGDEMSVEVSYDYCLEYDLSEFLEFIGVSEENVEEQLGMAAEYLTGFQTYYIYIGVKYAGIDMNTGDISTFISWQPADYIIVGEKSDNFYLIGELLLKFN